MSSNKNFQVYLTGGFAAICDLLFGYDTGIIAGVLTMSDFPLAFSGPASVTRGSLPSSVSGSIVDLEKKENLYFSNQLNFRYEHCVRLANQFVEQGNGAFCSSGQNIPGGQRIHLVIPVLAAYYSAGYLP
ncbi:unnamed protein product [Rotaria sp. Silwood2]|nr:unnamed protein product [Rotaria sp. Silwood2]CAF3010846.1 unnamed protein product [Rotaria sp. Silwood2]CAF3441361.1 unnamed protein product [Rotaria sp. Silwood2]CAF4094263.1 unnamed protein product [Rotaria sp. Silwood2]CAF4256874.1 unnamed protein product [Rotaria sp. Silwood2]